MKQILSYVTIVTFFVALFCTLVIESWRGPLVLISFCLFSFWLFLEFLIERDFRLEWNRIEHYYRQRMAEIWKEDNIQDDKNCNIILDEPKINESAIIDENEISKKPKSDLWKPNEAKRAYEPTVAPRPSMGSQLNALKDVQVVQVQVLENIHKGLRELRDDLKGVGIQNESLFDNLNWELQALREQEVNVNVTKRENGKFRHWTETRRYH